MFIICSILFLSSFLQVAFASEFETNYIFEEDKPQKKMSIPLAYTCEKVFMYFGKAGGLNEPQDLFIDKKQNIYVVDTGNNRILKITREGELLGVYSGPEDNPLSEPNGIYVDDDGDMYIADTGNNRVVHLSPDGKFVEEFVQPESDLYDKSYPFRPMKVFVDQMGYIYILNKDDYHGLIVIDAYNRFKGYIAPTKLGFSLRDLIIRLIATKEQKEMLEKRLPPAHSNFLIHSNGMIYATTIRTREAQIKVITPIGDNIYKKKDFFGEMTYLPGKEIEPLFVDLCVDKNGIISAVDASTGKIYQYDPEGHLLAVFGGYGAWKGKFINPTSIAIDDEENLYVLDATQNSIQVLKPTKFIQTVHYAISLYYQGKYKEAVKPWNEILKTNPNYTVANIGIAKNLMKEEKWLEAMEYYKRAEDITGYSQAFSEYRHASFRKYFLVYVLVTVALIILIAYLIIFGKQKTEYIIEKVRKY